MRLPAISALALALALMAACGDGNGQTPLPGSFRDCEAAAAAILQVVACNDARGVVLLYKETAYGPQGIQKVDQYFLIPLRVASVDDFRAKRDWAWEHWDVWQKENIDVCDVKLGPEPNSLMLQLAPEDFKPPGCP